MLRKSIPYGRQEITQQDIDIVIDTLQSDYLTQGPRVLEFETNFAQYIGCKYAVAVANGTAALHLCAIALGVDKDTNVITSPITFSASANCIRYCEGNIFFADINPNSFLLDINKVEQLILSKPSGFFQGIIPVDFAGYPIDLEAYRNLADKYNLWIIEDACHAPGGYFQDGNNVSQHCGNGKFAELAIFSFHPVKHIACGEGGMITTNDEKLYQKLLLLRTHGITKNPAMMQENHGGWYMEMQTLGYNYRMPDVLCALGTSQLTQANDRLKKRVQIARKYDQEFKSISDIVLPERKSGHAFHLYVIKCKDRLGLYNFLKEKSIHAQVHYIPVHTMPYYQSLGWKNGDFPLAEAYYDQCLSIPMYPSMSEAEQDYVIQMIKDFYKLK